MKLTVRQLAIAATIVVSSVAGASALPIENLLKQEIRKVQWERDIQDIPAGPTMRVGSTGERVLMLSKALRAHYSYTKITDVYTEDLANIVRMFQVDAGIQSDGIVGKQTLAILNWDKEDKLAALEFSLEKWNSRDLGNKAVVVNIPAFELIAVENGREAFRSKTIVGRPKHSTPEMISPAFSIKYNPDWNVPPGIHKRYVKKVEAGEMEYFTSQNIQIIRNEDTGEIEKFWQPPSRNSALGLMKIEMKNPHSIYMHDTNERFYFNRSNRARSSGCIRVEKYQELGAWLGDWDVGTIQRRIATDKTHWTGFDEVPVHVVYLTAWPDADGNIQYHRDVYRKQK